MSIKRSTSQAYVQRKQSIVDSPNEIVLLKKSQKLIQSAKQKRPIAPDKLKLMRHVFNTISNSQSSERFRSLFFLHDEEFSARRTTREWFIRSWT